MPPAFSRELNTRSTSLSLCPVSLTMMARRVLVLACLFLAVAPLRSVSGQDGGAAEVEKIDLDEVIDSLAEAGVAEVRERCRCVSSCIRPAALGLVRWVARRRFWLGGKRSMFSCFACPSVGSRRMSGNPRATCDRHYDYGQHSKRQQYLQQQSCCSIKAAVAFPSCDYSAATADSNCACWYVDPSPFVGGGVCRRLMLYTCHCVLKCSLKRCVVHTAHGGQRTCSMYLFREIN